MTSKKKIYFAMLHAKMGHSQAWLSLSNPGHKVITHVLFQLHWENISRDKSKPNFVCINNKSIQILYKNLSERPWCMHQKSITRGIDELLAKGFISIKEQGGSKKGHASIYSLSEAYLKWNKGDDPIEKRRPFSKRGFCK